MSTWQATGLSESEIRSWDGEHVFYHTPSGNTHLMSSVAADTLFRLRQSPADETTIARFIAEKLQLDVDDDFMQGVHDMLSELHSIALISRAA